ncbi:TIGR02281 family clan AA aspartic protease [Variovorax sp. PCZ-1]|uniref:retropepsin-like aspartic protease family protein n=1 Tax=Variovorax sp. PCZ-1 TaxID=2835533 RepID=UPI001BCCC227|nr:TIGR02281 family clan AA aspartic protease [Variovorax sp. PCZ-1]MBS7806993.1 TIGR02281 family clan AA aspartic protease [Variovorax sp. PCZ-1]
MHISSPAHGRSRLRGAKNALISIALCAVWITASAQKVALSGVMGSKGLLVIDGAAPKLLGAGETHAGVKLISASGDQAVLEIGGKRANLRVGDAPVSLGGGTGAGGGNKITLSMGSGGHFMANGTINGRAIQFMVDTGATSVAIGINDAQRMGIDYQKGQPVRMNTANGVAQGWRVMLNSVRVGDVEIYDVEAVVGPNMPFALLGNSFLSRFSMNRSSDVMVLERRF